MKALVLTVLTLSATAGLAAEPRPPGPGAAFNGVTESVVVEDFQQPQAFAVAAWVKLKALHEPQVFVNRGERGQLFTLYLFGGGIRMLVEYAPGRYAHALGPRPEVDTWTHYLGTYDGQTIQLFVDGELAASTEAAGAVPARDDALFIGARAPAENVVMGRLEDVRIYGAVLSPAQARRVMAGEDPAPNARLLGLSGKELEERIEKTDLAASGETIQPFAMGAISPTDGFRGIWYINQRREDGLHKYSGGLGTYPQQHIPIAIYAPKVNRTFFTYGGTRKDRNRLLHMVSVYDHDTGKVARPRILLDKHTTDAHDNPTMAIDKEGYIWIFSNAHGTGRPSYIHRSAEPYSIEAFTLKVTTNFSYSQPWFLPEFGFVFLHTRYADGRVLFVHNSDDGVNWSEPRKLAHVRHGHYQISWPNGSKIGTTFNYHPDANSPLGRGLNFRTNLYYMETEDGGKTWRNVAGELLELPLTEPDNPALAVEYESRGQIIYLKDIQYTEEGHPVILHLTTPGWQSGPENDPRTFTIARWTGAEWVTRPVTSADNNYDFASLYIEGDGTWRIIGSTEPGPQLYNTGGEMAMWISSDQGQSWKLARKMTENSEYNHTYPRRPLNAHPDFYAFWADGHGREMSPSRFYFANRQGDVFRLPFDIKDDAADWIEPERLR